MFNQFATIPDYLLEGPNTDWLLEVPDLSIGAKALYIVLNGLTHLYNRAIPSKQFLCDVLQQPREVVEGFINELKQFELIRVHRRENNSNVYEIMDHIWMDNSLSKYYLASANQNLGRERHVK